MIKNQLQESHIQIRKDPQVWKFCFYGFLKNLKFFEPYLYVYLLGTGINLFQIGLLFSIKEAVIYVFEVPSGIFADYYGKKNELVLCFLFYIFSFFLFFLSGSFIIIVCAMIFFGLGEAFRSGTHKAMIYSYLERKSWFQEKTFVYGRTRSFSMLGSAISALFSVIIILNLPSLRWIFLFSILPYMINFGLILSYPSFLNEKQKTSFRINSFFTLSIRQIRSIFNKADLVRIIFSSSVFDGVFQVIKDYIQPIMILLITGTGLILLPGLGVENNINVILGIVYFFFYIFSSAASRNVYRLNKFKNTNKLLDISFYILAFFMIAVFLFMIPDFLPGIIFLFFIMYIVKNARKPLVVDAAGDIMKKNERATTLSVNSQFKSLIFIILSPIFGLMAEKISISAAFLFTGIFLILVNFLFISKKSGRVF